MVFDRNNGMHIAAGGKVPFDFHVEGIAGGYEIIEDLIDSFFVGNVAIAITVDVKLNRFQFHHLFMGNIANVKRGKVRIAGKWTLTGELRQGNFNGVLPTGTRIGKCNQLTFLNGAFAILHF